MRKGYTELVFILDRSGSMGGLERDTIGGYNAMLAKQKSENNQAVITTVLFDDQYELLHNRRNLKEIDPITSQEYFVRGTTALLDAIGKTIHIVHSAQKHLDKKERAEKVLFVIITDGAENASRTYTYKKIKQHIKHLEKQLGWEFLFLGANIDAIKEADSFGISPEHCADYLSDSLGTALNFQAIGNAIHELRTHGRISENWKEAVVADYLYRKK